MSLFISLHLIHLMQNEIKPKSKPPSGPSKTKSLPIFSLKLWPYASKSFTVASRLKQDKEY